MAAGPRVGALDQVDRAAGVAAEVAAVAKEAVDGLDGPLHGAQRARAPLHVLEVQQPPPRLEQAGARRQGLGGALRDRAQHEERRDNVEAPGLVGEPLGRARIVLERSVEQCEAQVLDPGCEGLGMDLVHRPAQLRVHEGIRLDAYNLGDGWLAATAEIRQPHPVARANLKHTARQRAGC